MTEHHSDHDGLAAALVVMAEAGLTPDIGELLMYGNPSKGIAPHTLTKILARHAESARLSGHQQGVAEERERAAKIADDVQCPSVGIWTAKEIADAIRTPNKGEAK